MRIAIASGSLHITLGPIETIFALKNRLSIPLDHIESVSSSPATDLLKPLQRVVRFPGTSTPGFVRMGHYY